MLLITSAGKPSILQAQLQPYDGVHLLANAGKRVAIANIAAKNDTVLNTAIANLKAEVARLSGNVAEPTVVRVMAPDPTKPIVVQVLWANAAAPTKSSYLVGDAYALAATDSQFATTFTAVMVEIARQAGLTLS